MISFTDIILSSLLFFATEVHGDSLTSTGNVAVGDVNCRYDARTEANVSNATCAQLATKYGVALDKFFVLNPLLETDCSNIQPDTDYCVEGCGCAKSADHPSRSSGRAVPYLLSVCLANWLSYSTVIEPLRAWDRRCGPQYYNATCLGTAFQCCNSVM